MILTLVQVQVFLLILARVAGIFIYAPVLSTRTFPASAKTALALWISALLWFTVPVAKLPPEGALILVLLLIKEVVIGFLIGFVCHVLFAAIQAAGDIMDMQMGMSIATALDPSTGAVTSIVGKLCFYIALTVFLVLNGHHMVIAAVHQSFNVLPAGGSMTVSGNLVIQLIELGSSLLLVSVQLASPALLLIFISDFSFGIVSRVAPQVNVFMLGFQVKPTLGLLALLFALPLFIGNISTIINQMMQQLVLLFSNIR